MGHSFYMVYDRKRYMTCNAMIRIRSCRQAAKPAQPVVRDKHQELAKARDHTEDMEKALRWREATVRIDRCSLVYGIYDV